MVAYERKHGNCNVPDGYRLDPSLGNWVANQRIRKIKLIPARIRRLNELGFEWDPHETEWNQMFSQLVAYERKHGKHTVRNRERRATRLATWTVWQRRLKTQGKLNSERTNRLSEIGFDWNRSASLWEEMFTKLAAFKRKYGHCNVIQDYKLVPKLGSWVSTQRTLNARGLLTNERVKRLERLGFQWDPHESRWNQMFERLITYKKMNGNCNVPYDYHLDSPLGYWVGTQRWRRANGKLSADRIKRLERLGFLWKPPKGAAARKI